MKNTSEMINLESQVMQCYTYFMDNHKTSNLDVLEEKIRDLKKVMTRLTMTNLVNIIDRVVEDGRKNKNGQNKQYNISSLQILEDGINLVCHEVIGFDNVDKKYVLDSSLSYINFNDVIRIY